MDTTEHIVTLIHKQLSGAASAAEREELGAWIAADPAHEQTFNSYHTVWKESARVFEQQHFDVSAAWSKVDPRGTKVVPIPGAGVGRGFRWARLAVAAAVLVVAVAAWFLLMERPVAHEVVTAQAGDMEFTLPDGSVVFLRKGATLSYAKDFNQSHRKVKLSGEGYFEVTYEASKPFTIHTLHAVVQDLGTAFWLRTDADRDEMAVISGKVSFAKKQQRDDKIILNAGQQAKLEADNFQQSAVLDSNFLSWKTGILDFVHTPLPEVLRVLGDHYQKDIVVSPELVPVLDSFNIVLHINKGQQWEEVKDELQLMTGYLIEGSEDHYEVKRHK